MHRFTKVTIFLSNPIKHKILNIYHFRKVRLKMSDDLKVRKKRKPKSKSRKEEPTAATSSNEQPEFKVTTQIKRNVPIHTREKFDEL